MPIGRLHPSSSSEHRAAEDRVCSKLSKELGVTFKGQPVALNGLKLDAFADGPEPLLVEVFCHVGRCKSGQVRKLSRDMTKLLLAESLLGRRCRKLIALIDDAAKGHLDGSWDGEFARRFGIEFVTVSIPDITPSLREVQRRQQAGSTAVGTALMLTGGMDHHERNVSEPASDTSRSSHRGTPRTRR